MTRLKMSNRKSKQTSLRLSQVAISALDKLIESSQVPTNKTREVELAILGRYMNSREGGALRLATSDLVLMRVIKENEEDLIK